MLGQCETIGHSSDEMADPARCVSDQWFRLNHVHGCTINPQRPVAEPLMLKLLPLSVFNGHSRTCCWLDPLANDPICDVG
jgi:hypothetical protein